jgi:hypothetical protein
LRCAFFSKASAVEKIFSNSQAGVCAAELGDVAQLMGGKILVFKVFTLPEKGPRRMREDTCDDFE